MRPLFQNQSFLDNVLELCQDGIYITDNEANTIYLNHRYEEISGLKKMEMIGKNMKDLVESGVISVSGTLHVLNSGEEMTVEQGFRTGRRALITSSPVYEKPDDKSSLVMVVTIVKEITEMITIRHEVERLTRMNRQYLAEIAHLKEKLTGNVDMIAQDTASKRTLHLAQRVALLDQPVMISGESGSGKEKMARYIHENSERRECPFLCVDFSLYQGADPLSYLFGSKDDVGILSCAEGGTVYLQEICEMPETIKYRILALLRGDGCVMRDGRLYPLNVRLIAGSTHSYSEIVSQGLLEPSLIQYFAIFQLNIQPLRERRNDIIPLAEFFLKQHNLTTGEDKHFSTDCYRRLLNYDWPGNIYEIRMCVQRAAVICEDREISEEDLMLPDSEVASSRNNGTGHNNGEEFVPDLSCKDLKMETYRLEAYHMNRMFEKYGNIREAAESLGVDSSTFVRKRQKYVQLGLMDK